MKIYTDGSVAYQNNKKGNTTAPAGWAFVAVKNEETVCEDSGKVELDGCSSAFIGAEHSTNNTAELTAIYWALLYCHQEKLKSAVIYTDSKYAVGVLKGSMQANANKLLIKNVRGLFFPYVEKYRLKWIKGHAGNKFNERADELARKALHE